MINPPRRDKICFLSNPPAITVDAFEIAARPEIDAHPFLRRDEQGNANRNAVLERRLFPGTVLLGVRGWRGMNHSSFHDIGQHGIDGLPFKEFQGYRRS
jgi:hypothetical protein